VGEQPTPWIYTEEAAAELRTYGNSPEFKALVGFCEKATLELRATFDVEAYEEKFRRVVGAGPNDPYFESKLLGFLVGKFRSVTEAELGYKAIMHDWTFPTILATLDQWDAETEAAIDPPDAANSLSRTKESESSREPGPRKHIIADLRRIPRYSHKVFAGELEITEENYRDWRRGKSNRNDEIIRVHAAHWLSK